MAWVDDTLDFLLTQEFPYEIGGLYFSTREKAEIQIGTWRKWVEGKSVVQIKDEEKTTYRAIAARITKIRDYLSEANVQSHTFEAIRESVQILADGSGYSLEDAMRVMFISSMVRTKKNAAGTFIKKSKLSPAQMYEMKQGGKSLSEIGREAGLDKSTVSRDIAKYRSKVQT